jgi:AcrR family transcriptional regulator
MARRLPRGQQTREQILATALQLFARRGYGAVSIEEIAHEAGVTKGAVYHWFADKDDIGRELQHDLYERLSLTSMRAFVPGDDIVENMTRAFDAYLALLDDQDEARFFLRDAWVIPALDEAGRRDHEDAVAMMRDVLARAMDRSELVTFDPDALARVLMGVYAEATLHVLRSGDRDSAQRVVRHLVESLRATANTTTRGTSK